MTTNVAVDPDGLAALAEILAALAEQVVGAGHELTAVGQPALGGTHPAHELVSEVGTDVSSTATWVMTSGSALRALAVAAREAAAAYRATEQDATARWNAMAAAFGEFDDMYGLLTGPA